MFPRSRFLAAVRLAAFLTLILAPITTIRGQSAAGGRAVLLPAPAFTPDLRPWELAGKAEFAPDTTHLHDGHRAARITIGPGAPLSYQQLRQDFARDIRPGDEFRATVWVRTQDVTENPGAYMAVEFLDAARQRVGLAQSRTGAGLGRNDWEQIAAEGTAPTGSFAVRISLILHAHGTAWFADPELVRTGRFVAWPDLGDTPRSVTITPAKVVQPHFGGVGFHAFQHSFPAARTELDEIIIKRWRELRPSFARVNHEIKWDRAQLDRMAEHLQYMKDAGTEVYVTTWDPKVTTTAEARASYAREVVDDLEYLVRNKGLSNIHYYCMTNEMSLGKWGSLLSDLPTFQAYHQALYDELKARKLNIGLLASDASPVENWNTLTWAAAHMDGITAVYGAHHYINDRLLDDERFYPWFLDKTRWAVGQARAKKKNFILGEFGSKCDGRTIDGKHRDVCAWFDTPQEPLVATQIAEAAIAAINAGTYAMGYWTFMDFPDEWNPHGLNKWGLIRCSGADRSTRDLYYAYGLLTKFFRGPGTVVAVETNDPRLRAAALRHRDGGTWSIAIVNRNQRDVPLHLTFQGDTPRASLRKYVHDPAHPAQHPFGDLPGPTATIDLRDGRLTDTLAAGTLTVYTSDFDARPPARVAGLKIDRAADGRDRLTWTPSPEADLCYYRIFCDDKQIGSTVATTFFTALAVPTHPLPRRGRGPVRQCG